jgi:CBS domain-containing protein
MTAQVSAVLKHKGQNVVTAAPDQSVASVVTILDQHRIGAVPVVDSRRRLAGIVSERDVIRALANHGVAALDFPVERLMTREVRTCAISDPIEELMHTMTFERIRHLPVIQDGALVGIVSIGDVVKQRLSEFEHEVEELHNYIRS